MGPNGINNSSAMLSANLVSPQTSPASASKSAAAGGIKINYGDASKAKHLKSALDSLQHEQSKTRSFIRTANPMLPTLG